MLKLLVFVDTANDIDGKHDITGDVIKKLTEKHPKAEKIQQSAIINTPETKTQPKMRLHQAKKACQGLEDQHRLTWKLGKK